ncbi:gametocyte-specific factor 1 homolog [Drosophila tropicalis]|uniref:gametocyte-specific factor 1 homolog n=1 Tax=Drosophila tropicalis TaxID=46794 RepID=UPI0035AB76E5
MSALEKKTQEVLLNWVKCPFDEDHRILPTRLVIHLNRCARNHSGLKMVRCPFDITHVLKVNEMEGHVAICPSRKKDEMPICFEELPELKRQQQVETSDTTWDDEPVVATYDPQLYCAANPVVRMLRGANATERHQFREQERARFRAFREAAEAAPGKEDKKKEEK